jgi:hypothetical protein
VGETFLVTAHQRLRILAIDFDLDDELVASRGSTPSSPSSP